MMKCWMMKYWNLTASNLEAAMSRTSLVFTLALATTLLGSVPAVFSQGPPSATVVIARVQESIEAVSQSFVGTLEPRKRSVVGSAVAGRVEEFPVNDGEWVNKGEKLAGLLEETMKIEIENADAELDVRKEELQELLSGSLAEEKNQAKALRDAAQAQLKYAKSRHARAEGLFQRGTGITNEEMDLANSTLTAAEKNLEAAQSAWQLLEDGPRPEKINQAKARVAAAQAMVDSLENRLLKYTIRAPFDGYVVTKSTELGAWINTGDPIAEVISIDPIEVAVSVPEGAIPSLQAAMAQANAEKLDIHYRDLKKKRKEDEESVEDDLTFQGLKVEVVIDAFGSGSNDGFEGAVHRIVPQADLRSRTFPVKVWIQNPVETEGAEDASRSGTNRPESHKLKAGMICHVKLPGVRQKVMLVPKDALVLSRQGSMLWVVDETAMPPVANAIPVEMGASYGSTIHVISKQLKAGMAVITRGNERLRPNQPLNIVKEEK